jgi:hypothetical protein
LREPRAQPGDAFVLRVHAFYCTLALLIVQLIEREGRRAGIELGTTLALRALSDIHETTTSGVVGEEAPS